MIRPDFRDYKGRGVEELMHSAKGTTWKNHKYLKKVDGRYIYPKERFNTNLSKRAARKRIRNTGDVAEGLGEGASSVSGAANNKEVVKNASEVQKLSKQYNNQLAVTRNLSDAYMKYWRNRPQTLRGMAEYVALGKKLQDSKAKLNEIKKKYDDAKKKGR